MLLRVSKRERHERKLASKERGEDAVYRRRRGVVWRPSQLGIPREARFGWFWFPQWVNDGGNDAPLDGQSNRFFKHLTFGAIAVVILMIVAAVLSR